MVETACRYTTFQQVLIQKQIIKRSNKSRNAFQNNKKTPDECSCNSSQLHSSCLITHYEAKYNTILNYSSATSHGSTKRYGSDERQKAEKFQP